METFHLVCQDTVPPLQLSVVYSLTTSGGSFPDLQHCNLSSLVLAQPHCLRIQEYISFSIYKQDLDCNRQFHGYESLWVWPEEAQQRAREKGHSEGIKGLEGKVDVSANDWHASKHGMLSGVEKRESSSTQLQETGFQPQACIVGTDLQRT